MKFISKYFSNHLLPILFIISIGVNVISFESIHVLQGDSRTMNYIGFIRGGTQLLIKQELLNNPNDELIEDIKDIILELKQAKDENLMLTKDPNFQEDLLEIENDFLELINEIYVYRKNRNYEILYNLSDAFFVKSNEFVYKYQHTSEEKMDKILLFRPLELISSAFIIIIYIYQLISIVFLKKRTKKLKKIAYIDSLSKLSNRIYLDQLINKYRKMEKSPNLACIYFDLNNLKEINDTYSHTAGDQLIKDFSNVLRENSKGQCYICRNGGDEFVALFENHSKEDIQQFIQQVNSEVECYNSMESKIKISFAYGIAFSNEFRIHNINDLLILADQRMYKNKAEYKKKKRKMSTT